MDVRLVMFKADGTRRDFPVNKPRVVVGRKHSCDLRIPLNSVSRQHCELTFTGDVLKVRDLGSSNGTYHNSNRVQEAELGPGDELVIGPVVFTIVIDGEPTTIEPVRTILNGGSESEELHATVGSEGGTYDLNDDNDDSGPRIEQKREASNEPAASQESGALNLDDPLAALEALDKQEDDDGSSLGEFEFLMDDEEEKKKGR